MKYTWLTVCFWCFTTNAASPADRLAQVPALWATEQANLADLVERTAYSPPTLYQLQDRLGLFLNFAFRTGNTAYVDQALALLQGALAFAPVRQTYVYDPGGAGTPFEGPMVPARRVWVDANGRESLLHSSQFLYLLSRTVKEISARPVSARTTAMRNFLAAYAPVVRDHLLHWLFSPQGMFQVKGWGCANGLFNHSQFLEKKKIRAFGSFKSYCNAVTDIDLWIVASTAELLGALRSSPSLPVSPSQAASFGTYLDGAFVLIQSRLSQTKLRRPSGARVYGLIFDKGAWKDHETNRYSGFEGVNFPTPSEAAANPDVTWDVGHARRFVFVVDSLVRNARTTAERQLWESKAVGLANQFAFGIFGGDTNAPLFRNYFDGANGWYRVGYDGRPGFGYSPWSRSADAGAAGYCLWSGREARVGQICEGVHQVIEAPAGSEKAAFRAENYEMCHHDNYVRRPCAFSTSSRLNLIVSTYPSGVNAP